MHCEKNVSYDLKNNWQILTNEGDCIKKRILKNHRRDKHLRKISKYIS